MTLARAFRLLLLAAALLAGWQGALLHPLEHHDSRGGLVHVAGIYGPQSDSQHKSGNDPNALCDVIAALTACVEGSPPIAVAAHQEHDPLPALHRPAPAGATAPPYRSQAPPALL
jgi:hypothetical protein